MGLRLYVEAILKPDCVFLRADVFSKFLLESIQQT